MKHYKLIKKYAKKLIKKIAIKRKKRFVVLQQHPVFAFKPSISICVLGETFFLEHSLSAKNQVEENDGKIVFTGDLDAFNQNVRLWLYEYAKQKAYELSHNYAKSLGVDFNKILIKDMKTRWGSCSSKGNISYNWRLVFAPINVFKYLCAHEVAHLVHPHHQPAFWKAVEMLHPTYKQDRQWLKTNSYYLWQYG